MIDQQLASAMSSTYQECYETVRSNRENPLLCDCDQEALRDDCQRAYCMLEAVLSVDLPAVIEGVGGVLWFDPAAVAGVG